MNAIIEVDRTGSAVRAARKQLTSSRRGQVPDFRLSFGGLTCSNRSR
jgi:hypothetical protein